MSLVARIKSSEKLINIADFESPRKQIDKSDIECHLCKGELVIKSGMFRIKHFAHKSSCTCDYDRHPESFEHDFLKRELAKRLNAEFEEYFGIEVQNEFRVPEARRIADIAFVFPSGWVVVHEVQLSSITVESIEQRTNDYRSAGIDVVWWLGKSANTPNNRKWLLDKYGECHTVDYDLARENNPKNKK